MWAGCPHPAKHSAYSFYPLWLRLRVKRRSGDLKDVPIPTPSGLGPGDPWPKKWAVAARLPFLTACVMPVLAALAASWRAQGSLRPWLALLTLVGVALIHAGFNLANDFFDHLSGADAANRVPTPFSGGSRVIQDGVVSPRAVLVASLVLLAAGSACGIVLWLATPGHTLLAIGLAGMALGWFYTSPPIRLAHRGLGELAVGVAFGALPVLGTEWVQRGCLSLEVAWVGLPAGLLVAAILLVNEFPDAESDAGASKRNLVVRLGRRRAARGYAGGMAAAYLVLLPAVAGGWLPPLAAVVVLVAPLSWKATRVLRAHHSDVRALLPAMAATIAQQAIFLLLLAGACLADFALHAW